MPRTDGRKSGSIADRGADRESALVNQKLAQSQVGASPRRARREPETHKTTVIVKHERAQAGRNAAAEPRRVPRGSRDANRFHSR